MADQQRVMPKVDGQTAISFEAFLTDYAGRHAEWIDGEVIEIVGISWLHNEIANFIYALFTTYLKCYPIGKAFAAPLITRFADKTRGREPDVCFLFDAVQLMLALINEG